MKRYMYVAVRRDLSHAQQVVQACHAAIEASQSFLDPDDDHPSVIVLGMKNEKALEKFKDYVHNCNFHYDKFFEPDRDNEMTSVAVFPVGDAQKVFFKKFQLLK